MSRRYGRRRRSRVGVIMDRVVNAWASLTARPLRTGLAGVLSLAAIWLVLTKSLPCALAPAQPDAALALNPNNPAALVANAEKLEKRLIELTRGGGEHAKAGESASEGRTNTLARLPEVKAGESGSEPLDERETLRGEIRDLALRAIANDPLNARTFRLLAEVTAGSGRVRFLMQASLDRSRHEPIAAFWLLNDSFYHKDFRAVLRYADILLRTHPELGTYVFAYLSLIAESPEGRDLLMEQLRAGPAWRQLFFEALPRNAKNLDTPLALITALQDSAKPVSGIEVAPYLNFLIGMNRVDLAYNAWLQFLPNDQLKSVRLLTNAGFDSKPSGLPFDWRIGNGVNALAEIVPLEAGRAEHALHIGFSDGRVQFPEVSQIVLLAPGRYRLEGKLRGTIAGKRGLRWQLRCASGSPQVLAETDMLLGQSEHWRVFTLEAEVPELEDCRGQTLRLFHNSRSASEELLSGEVWFHELRLERVQRPAVQ